MQNTMFQPITPVSHVMTLVLVVLALPPLTACSVYQVLLKNSLMTDPCKLSYANEYLHHKNCFTLYLVMQRIVVPKPSLTDCL